MGMYIPNMKSEQFYDLCKEHGLEIIAIPIPPHGRLIDADAAVANRNADGNWVYDLLDLPDYLAGCPTIILAEEGE